MFGGLLGLISYTLVLSLPLEWEELERIEREGAASCEYQQFALDSVQVGLEGIVSLNTDIERERVASVQHLRVYQPAVLRRSKYFDHVSGQPDREWRVVVLPGVPQQKKRD